MSPEQYLENQRKLQALTGIPEPEVFLREWLPLLEQAPHIEEKTALRWRERTIEVDGPRFAWHFRRLSGIGGSEIGEVLVDQLPDVDNQFKTRREIVESKLMLRTPEPQNVYTRRGTLLEPIIQQIFQEDYQARTHQKLLAAVEAHVNTDHRWIKNNLDDLVMIQGQGNRLFVIDYKSTSTSHSDSALQYGAQLNQYGWALMDVARKHGQEIEAPGLINAYFNYELGCVDAVEVPYDERLIEQLLDAGDATWQMVCEGRIPDWPKRNHEPLELDESEQAQLEQLEDAWLRAKFLADAAIARQEKAQQAVQAHLSRGGQRLVNGYKPQLNLSSVVSRLKPDAEGCAELLRVHPELASSILRSSKRMNANAMSERLRELDPEIDLEQFIEEEFDPKALIEVCRENALRPPVIESLSLQLSRKKVHLPIRGALAEQAGALIDEVSPRVDESAELDLEEDMEEELGMAP